MRIIGQKDKLLVGDMFETARGSGFTSTVALPHGGWPQASFIASSILGIRALESWVRAPFVDRPILQQSFELALTEDGSFSSLEEGYVSILSSYLGEPKTIKIFETKAWHSVRYSATWLQEDFRVSLSIFGSARQERTGVSTAGLYIDLMDEISLAVPYLAQRKNLEESLWPNMDNLNIKLLFPTIKTNHAFFYPDFEGGIVSIDDVTDLLRRSQKVLYKRELLETPHQIVLESKGKGLALWSSTDSYFLSLDQDTVQLQPQVNPFEIHKIHPARGPGGTQLVLGELWVRDSYESKALYTVMSNLEEILGQAAKQEEYYDE